MNRVSDSLWTLFLWHAAEAFSVQCNGCSHDSPQSSVCADLDQQLQPLLLDLSSLDVAEMLASFIPVQSLQCPLRGLMNRKHLQMVA